MKLNRKLVIKALTKKMNAYRATAKQHRAAEAKEDAAGEAKLVKAARAFVIRQTEKTKQGLYEAVNGRNSKARDYSYQADRRESWANQIEAEIRLLNLSDEETIQVRNNSDLARWL